MESEGLEKQFIEACGDGNIEVVEKLLQNPKINPNYHGDSWTPFYCACYNGRTEIVKLLLNDQRVDLNKADYNGETPFFIACYFGHIELVKLLLNDKRVDINRPNKNGQTPFYFACFYGGTEIVKLLLNDERIDVNKADYDGKTPFSIACTSGKTEVVKLLLNDQRVDLNKADYDGETPLCGACLNACVILTFDHGWIEDTSLHVACQNVEIEVVKLLLNDKRISIRKKTSQGKTAMSIAKEWNCSEIVKLIKEFDTEQRYLEYLETFQHFPFLFIEKGTINKQDFHILNEHLKNNKNIKGLLLTNCDLTPSNILEILKTLIWKYENGQLSNLQNIELDDIKLESTEGLEIIPIEIRNQGTKSIVQYILDLCQSPNSNPLYRTKLMVVGYENVGKTTILDCLFPIIDLRETQKILKKSELLTELQGKYLRRYKSKELNKDYEETILENRKWNVQEIKETGLELIPLNDKPQKKLEIYFKNQETRDKWIERLKRVILNSATHGIEIQNQILQNQNKLSNVVKSIHSSSDQQNLTPNINVSIWDFAGQHDYYNNHHYFLSTRTVFLVLWKMKDGKNGLDGLNFWFKSLSSHLQHDSTSLANNKPYFSILVVGTFLDDQNVKKSEESKKLREQEISEIAKSNGIHYPIQIYEVSCSTLDNINELKQSIYKTALTHGYMGEKLPIGYLHIKNSIEELRDQEKFKNLPIVSLKELIDDCKTNSTFEFDDEFVKRALKLLHLWGTCVYFDEPKELSNYVILKPEFLTKEVMGKLFKPNLRNTFKDGILNHSNLKLFWPNYMDKSEMLMTLMEKFEICFKLKEDEGKSFKDQRSLIVSYLPENQPNNLSTYWPNELSNKNEEIERTIIFNMIPKEMVSRLFVCLQHKIEDQSIWRYGMAFISKENKNIRAFVNVETELINQKGNDKVELKSNDQFKIKNQIIIKVRGENLKNRKELMDDIIEEIWKCSKKYSGVVCYQMISSPFDSSSNGLIQLSDCLLEITKPKDKQGILCPTTKNIINPIELLLKSGMIYQSEIIEEKKKEIEEAINKVKEKNNLNEDQTQELLNNPQLKTILMTEILKNKNQDSDKKIESNQLEQKLDQNQTQEVMQIVLEISKQQQQLLQGQDFTNIKVDSAVGATIHAMEEKEKHGYPSCFLLLPLIKEQSKASTSTFQKMFQKVKEKVEDLIFDKSQLHCFCEFKVRCPKNGQLQPLFHPTNSPGIEIKELNEVMKKVGPTLKVASVILQVISISAKFAGIPFPHASKVIDQVVEYSEKAQEIFGNCAMKIESLKEMTKEDIIKRMNQNGTSELKLQPLEGDIIGTFKNNDMFGESQNGYLEKAGLYQKFIKFDNEYGNKGDVLWVCKDHYDLLQDIENNQSIELKNEMVEIFSSSWSNSNSSLPKVSNDFLSKNNLPPLIQDDQRDSSKLFIQSDKKTFILNHEGCKYKIKNCSTLEEIKGNIRMQLELTLQVIIKIKYLDNDGEYYVASDFDDLKDATKLEISLEFKNSDQELKTSPGFKF